MNAIQQDNFIVDSETGEVLERLGVKEEFHVTDEESALWVLKKLTELEAERVALEARKTALVYNMDKMLAEVERNISGLTYRFKAELEACAKSKLAGSSKTWRTPYGSVGFRSTPASYALSVDKDSPQLIEWAKTACPAAIKTSQQLLVRQVPEDMKALAPEWFTAKPAAEQCYIKTGVESE